MEPLTIISDSPFPSRAIFWPSGHTKCRSGGVSGAGAAYLYQLEANGSSTYLTKVTAPDGAAAIISETPFPSRAIFWPSGHTEPIRGVYPDAGAAYLYQLEANGSATYLTKVTAPDGAASDYFGTSVSQSGNILAVGAILPIRGDIPMPGQSIPLIWPDFLNFRKKLPLPMVSPAIISDTPFPSRAIFLPSGHTMPIRGVLSRCRGGLSLSIGSQWIRYIPDQGNRSRWSSQRSIRNVCFPVGQYSGRGGIRCRSGGLSDAGAAYLYQLEANGSATYLTKVTAPDGASGDDFGMIRFPVGQYSCRRGILCHSGRALQCRSGLSLSIGSQWIRYLPDQGNRSRWSRRVQFGIPFPSRAIFWPSGHTEQSGGVSNAGAAYLYQLEANGSATYLTKVTAPDGAAEDLFGISVSQSGNILAVGAYYADPGAI